MKSFIIKNKVFRISVVACAVIASTITLADEVESLKFTGEVNSVLPVINVSISDTPTAFVENVKLAIEENATHCDFVTESARLNNSYIAGTKPICLFEWGDSLNGLSPFELSANGVANVSGEVDFNYQISLIDKGVKEVFFRGVFTVDIDTPTNSVITSIKTKTRTGKDASETIENYDKKNGIEQFIVTVEPKTFDQKVSILDQTCIVKEGDTTCEIDMNSLVPGANDPILVGSEKLSIQALDNLDYLPPAIFSLELGYDYRPPIVEAVYINGTKEETLEFTVDGETLIAQRDMAYFVVHTPHFNKDGDWWKPLIKGLVATNKSEPQPREITIEGEIIRLPSFATLRDEYVLTPNAEYSMLGSKLIYSIPINDIADGIYDISARITDTYDNDSTVEELGANLDRSPPQIVGLINGRDIASRRYSNVIFLNDIYFAASSGWNDGTQISEVFLNGENIVFETLDNGVVRLEDRDDLEIGSENSIKVIATDNGGNLSEEVVKFTYIDAEYRLSSKIDSVYAGIQSIDSTINKIRGSNCLLSSDSTNAITVSNKFIKGCVVEFNEIPSNIEMLTRNNRVSLSGVIDEIGMNTIDFTVAYYHQDGSVKRINGGTGEIEVTEMPNIKLTLTDFNKVADRLYAVPINNKNINRIDMNFASVDTIVSTESLGLSAEAFLRQFRRPVMRNITYRPEKVSDEKPALWSKIPYTVTAKYARKQEIYDSEDFDVIVTPSTRTQLYLVAELPEKANTKDTIKLTANVGIYNRRLKSTEYIPEDMGDWEIQIAVKDGLNYVPISEKVDISPDGSAVFEIGGQDLFEQGRVFYALADAKSPLDDYGMQITSRAAVIEILKGGVLEGNITTRTVSRQIPFTTALRFKFNTLDDLKAAQEYVWERSSEDGIWTEILGYKDERSYLVELLDPITESYRVKMVNRISGIESYSDEIAITGFEVADLTINGPRYTSVGLPTTYVANIGDDLRGESDGTYEWSVDRGETWEAGTDTYVLTPEESFEIQVRHRLNSSNIEDESTYAVDEMRVTAYVPEKLRLIDDSNRYLETGVEGRVAGRYRLFNSRLNDVNVIEQITLPNGDVVDASAITFIPYPEDIDKGFIQFKYSAWVEGLKEATQETLHIDVRVYNYTFNAPELDMYQRYSIAPTTARGRVDLNIDGESPDTEFTYNWSVAEGNNSEVVNERGNTASFLFNEEGSQIVTVVVSDNKGNEAELTKIVDIENKASMEIELLTRFNKDYMTAPIGISTRTRIQLEHPRDYTERYDWYLNNEIISEDSFSRRFFEINEPGDYTLTIKAKSKFGQEGEESYSFTINPNIPPTCAPMVNDEGNRMSLIPNCSDLDGTPVAFYYQWDDNDEIKLSGNSVNFSKDTHPTQTVTIRVVDDGGEEASFTARW